MADAASSTQKDRILSHGAHEIRTPLTVILGYVRMLMSERLGATTEAQQKAFGEIQKTASKLKEIADEMTDLGKLLAGGTTFTRTHVDLGGLIDAAMASLAPPDREVSVRFVNDARGATVDADAALLQKALGAIIHSLRRELVTSEELCVALDRMTHEGRPMARVTIGGADRIEDLRRVAPSALAPFVEVRGGVGLTLFIARQVIEAHGGQILSRVELKEDPALAPMVLGAVLLLPVVER